MSDNFWEVLERVDSKFYKCKCICGKIKKVNISNFRGGKTTNCGCKRREKLLKASTSHGKSKTKEYQTWLDLKRRCCRPDCTNYQNYGGRGIKVCDRWLDSFENFFEDMGERPSKNYSIERNDVNGDYEPENCVWVENDKQSRNQRKKKNNTSGVTGVRFDDQEDRWRCYWNDLESGKQKLKSFSVSKYGEEAFRLACEYRSEMIKKLNKQGAGYSEGHGV